MSKRSDNGDGPSAPVGHSDPLFPDPESLRAARKRLRNPYAFIEQLEDDSDTMAQVRRARRKYENPYALNEYLEDSSLYAEPSRTRRSVSLATASKKEFRDRSRQIFLGYSPATSRARLRPHHREFITRNESRPATERAALLAELSKYDIRSTPGVRPQFNRERDTFTAAKLMDIERAVDGTEE